MDVLTLYADQGSLVGIRTGNEGIIVDAHMPDCGYVTPSEIQQSLSVYFKDVAVRGLVLTGFDADHAHAVGLQWLLWQFVPDWIMYPKYFKDTDNAATVFRSIEKHEKRRASTSRPLVRHSVRLDRMDFREIKGLGQYFTIELFSPHVEDMDSSNNCSIVAKITGAGSSGFRYLATGDTETNRWEAIDRLFGGYLASDVMAAAYHGALSGMHAKTLLNVSPNTVLISAGVESQYDHPHGAAIGAYQAVAQHVWSTNAGAIANNLLTRRSGSDFSTVVFPHAFAAA
jgi:beta-lactamase superfamily II metal-dependent hydrolase